MSQYIPSPAALGLTEKEAQIYELLVNTGEMDAARIIQETKLKRPTVYKSLYTLEQKGLITQRKALQTTIFRPEAPQKLLEVTQNQFAALERARGDLQAIIPLLTASYMMSTERPVVSIFEGVNGLKKIYEDTLKEKAEIKAVLQTSEVEPELYKWLTGNYAPRRAQAQVFANVIVASGNWSEDYIQNDEKEYRKSILVPSALYPFAHEVDIYANKVAFINFKKGEKLIGIIIENAAIAATMRAWFDLAWQGALMINQNHQPSLVPAESTESPAASHSRS